MPLFGSKDKQYRDTTGNISTSGQQPYDVPGSAPMDPGTQGRNNYDNNVRSHQQAPYDGAGQTGPNYQGPLGQSNQMPISGNGPGPNPASSGVYHQGGNYNHHSGGGMGTKLTGKVESALGSMVGSSTLKAKGLEKEREANSANMQALELAEAERLEREAMMRRQKVLGHGAYPVNSGPGVGQSQLHPGVGMTGGYPQ